MADQKHDISQDRDERPLSENDVAEVMRKCSNIDAKVINRIFQSYYNTVASLISIGLEQSKNLKEEDDIVELERLKRLMGFCPVEDIFVRTHGKVWKAREHILTKNKAYFIERDYSSLIKRDGNQAFIESLIEIIKFQSKQLSDQQMLPYWKKAAEMLKIIIEFKTLTGELQ